MAQTNSTTFVGNLTRDPELKFTNGGMAICTIGVAVNHRFQRNGEWEEEVSFFDATAFGDFGENIAESLNKGDRVIASGRLKQRSWETESGDKRSKIELVLNTCGPSLEWATCEVTRNERKDGNSGGGRSSGGSKSSGSRRSGGDRADALAGDDGYNEEPF